MDRWPGVALGAISVAILSDANAGAAALAGTYGTMEALLATWLIRRGGAFDLGLGSVRDVVRFVISAVVAAAVTAVIGALNLTLFARTDPEYWPAWVAFFVGDVLGMLSLAPGLLVWGSTRLTFTNPRRELEFFGLVSASCMVGLLVFGQALWPTNIVFPLAYLSFP